MTLFERGLGSGDVSLAALFDDEEPSPVLDSGTSVREALDALVHGGWPGDPDASTAQTQRHLRDYVENLVTIDVGRLNGEPRRDPIRLRALLRSLARHVATEASFATIARDVSARTLSAETAIGYVNALKRLFIVEEQPAWAPHLRSRYAVRTSSTAAGPPSRSSSASGRSRGRKQPLLPSSRTSTSTVRPHRSSPPS